MIAFSDSTAVKIYQESGHFIYNAGRNCLVPCSALQVENPLLELPLIRFCIVGLHIASWTDVKKGTWSVGSPTLSESTYGLRIY